MNQSKYELYSKYKEDVESQHGPEKEPIVFPHGEIANDANLKFKTILRGLRERNGYTQVELAKELGMSASKYKRLESISGNYQVTLNESAEIYRLFSVKEGFQEILHFLSPKVRQEIIDRVNLTYDFLKLLSSGKVEIGDIEGTAKTLLVRYESTSKVVGLI